MHLWILNHCEIGPRTLKETYASRGCYNADLWAQEQRKTCTELSTCSIMLDRPTCN